jgi:hypothetical protein
LNDVALVHGVGNKHERRDLTAALPLKSCVVIALQSFPPPIGQYPTRASRGRCDILPLRKGR